MNLAIVKTRVQSGMQAIPVTVEVHLSNGLPCFAMVGLPETVVKESRERVRSAILNSQFEFPDGRITVNLAPADIPKEGGRFDLPIALGILIASMQIQGHLLEDYEFAGELALNGEIRPIQAALPFAYACAQAKKSAVLPYYNCQDAGLIEGIQLYSASTLLDVCAHLQGQHPLPLWEYQAPIHQEGDHEDLADIIGQNDAKRALIVAAAGGHHLLMQGPPGTGKTMLASRLPGILPPMTDTEAIETASLYSIRGHSLDPQAFYQRPFRRPHHTSSGVALVGGGSIPKPGEISLAHKGVLFLDELPEFDRKVLEVLREPLETGVIHLSRARDQIEFPADFQLIAAMNPCPCGYLGSKRRTCRCRPEQVLRYQNKLSGPLLDRIDLHVRLNDIDHEDFLQKPKTQARSSRSTQEQIMHCREKQLARQGVINAQLKNKPLETHCALQEAEQKILLSAMRELQLSPRSTHRLLRVARTIADLEDSARIMMPHLSEALGYRAA